MTQWPEEQATVARFREWLEEVRSEAEGLADGEDTAGPPPEFHPVGLYQLVEEFTALRHEVKLGTKSSRGLEEQTSAALEAMKQAVDQFRSVEADTAAAAEQASLPFVEALCDLDEALRRGRTVIERARRRILEESSEEIDRRLVELYERQYFLGRFLTRRWYEAVRRLLREQRDGAHRELLDALLEGYDLVVNRLQRAMKQEQIFRMECAGRPADPNTMTVIEVIDDETRPPGLVVEEVRPGYYWKSKPFRFAEVRAVRTYGKTDS